MARLLNPQHEAFCHAFVRGPHAGNLCDAYEAAGYARDRGNAARLARQPDVVARVNALRDGEAAAERAAVRAALGAHAIDKARIVQELATIAFANPLDFIWVDADGKAHVDLTRIDRAKGGAIRELVVESIAPTDKTPAVTKVRLRFNDKHRALTELARQIDLAQEPPLPVETTTQPVDEETHRASLVAQLRDLADHDEDVVALATRAAAAANPMRVGFGKATPARRAYLRKGVEATATQLQQALSEGELVEGEAPPSEVALSALDSPSSSPGLTRRSILFEDAGSPGLGAPRRPGDDEAEGAGEVPAPETPPPARPQEAAFMRALREP
jgi:hypothetical protein